MLNKIIAQKVHKKNHAELVQPVDFSNMMQGKQKVFPTKNHHDSVKYFLNWSVSVGKDSSEYFGIPFTISRRVLYPTTCSNQQTNEVGNFSDQLGTSSTYPTVGKGFR